MRTLTAATALRMTLLGGGLFAAMTVHAEVLNLNFTAVSPDGVAVTNSVVNAALNAPAALSTSSYSHTLPVLNFAIPGSTGPVTPAGFEFYDDYVFTIGNSALSNITATIDLGSVLNIDNLNVRLFSWNGTAEQLSNAVTIGSTSPNTLQAWTYATGSGEVAVIDQTGVAAGTYVLQVRGNVTGAAGGSYVGGLNVAPVPVPAALPLLCSGLGLIGGVFRRRTLHA